MKRNFNGVNKVFLTKKKAFIFLFFGLSLTFPLQAGFKLGVFAGQSWQKPDYQNLQFNTDTCWVYGVRASIKVLILGLEGYYFQVAHNLQLGDISHSWQDRKVDFSCLGMAVKSYFSLLIVHPYLSLGYGYYSVGLQGITEERKAGLNFGAGLEISLGDKLSLQAEARYHRPVLNINKADFRLGDLVVTGGLNYHF